MARNGVITRKCAYHGCNNRVSSDRSTFPYCHIPSHQGGGDDSRPNVAMGSLAWSGNPEATPPTARLDPRAHSASLYAGICDLEPQDLEVVMDCYDRIRDGRDFSIPGNIPADVNVKLHDEMSRGGFDGRRLRLYTVRGFNRRRDSKVDSNPDYTHTIIGVDPDSSRPDTVIDALTPAFAPVKRSMRDAPIENSILSGSTPYTEYPWVGRSQDYLNGSHMWWDSIERSTS